MVLRVPKGVLDSVALRLVLEMHFGGLHFAESHCLPYQLLPLEASDVDDDSFDLQTKG